MASSKFCFAIDRGGTFTDVFARCPNGEIKVLKLLSEDPHHYKDAPTEGIRRILEEKLGSAYSGRGPIKTEHIDWIRMGTTVATNALLERKGERMALAITKGFRELLHIGNQTRPDIFDLKVECPSVLYEDVVEIDERVIPAQGFEPGDGEEIVTGTTMEKFIVTKKIDAAQVEKDLKSVRQKGITSLAVLLLHSYKYPEHETIVKGIASLAGFAHVSLSSEVMPMVRAVPRGFTACSDAYLTPHVKNYLQGFQSGFENRLEGVNVLFMQSDGGLTNMDSFNGSRGLLSGPAGGVVGYALTAYDETSRQPVIGFDMGGTSTDVSRYGGGFEHVFETTTAGVTVQAPQLDINTVAAGGGSRLFFRSGLYVVGPESAGAHPGPACYKKGGPLAVTDANLVLGRLLPQFFPKIFGKKENEPLDKKTSMEEFSKLQKQIWAHPSQNGQKLSVDEIALGFVRVANEAMCRPIMALTQAKGHDTSKHALAVFGGAGGQHACAVARALGVTRIHVHKYAGILSAVGIAVADVVTERQEPAAVVLGSDSSSYICTRLHALEQSCITYLRQEGFPPSDTSCKPFLNLRYEGTDFALMVCLQEEEKETQNGGYEYLHYEEGFTRRYQSEFGFTLEDRSILVDDLRVRGVGKSKIWKEEDLPEAMGPPHLEMECDVFFTGGAFPTKVFLLKKLGRGHVIEGPAIIIDQLSTILVEPGCTAKITRKGDIIIDVGKKSTAKESSANESNVKENASNCESNAKETSGKVDAIQLSIFSHRFMSIAEQMGRVLQRTSISTNIKERLDFSCAVFGPDGGLVSNAPHIPVHLGAMQETVQYQISRVRTPGGLELPASSSGGLSDGDVLLSNHPTAGGSHLPDLTVITPVFRESQAVFYVASRGHHADIGGTTPGSMPPDSTSIYQEGAVFMSFKLVDKGVFQEAKLVEALMAPGSIPGSSGTRNLRDNLSDLRAQVAANCRGILLVNELIDEYGLAEVQAYMGFIQDSAETAVRELLKKVAGRVRRDADAGVDAGGGKRVTDVGCRLTASDWMDDGSTIQLQIELNEQDGTAVFDFSGTGPEVLGNCNAPRAITASALIYCLRALVDHDIPLNQGCLKPVTVKIPPGSILAPSDEAAVVGGNVQTSQRVVDVILKAFDACAASQGCMNNVTFGDNTLGYYETVCGGAGAGPGWHGRSGVHTHMTNTRITDPEILEQRYPVILETFCLNLGTGGDGKFKGGDGVIRKLKFRKGMKLSILTERRVFAPYGLDGGSDGAKGQNFLVRKSGKVVRIPSKASVDVYEGDTFCLYSPGGGGYGTPSKQSSNAKRPSGKRESNDGGSPGKRVNTRLRGSVFEYTKNQESA